MLAFALLMAQPLHWMACCLTLATGTHVTPLSSHIHEGRRDVTSALASRDQEHQQADAYALVHTSLESEPRLDGHQNAFVITTHCIRSSHRHHPPCCADSITPALSPGSSRPLVDAVMSSALAAPAVPPFRLDVLEGRFTRAGPTDARPRAPHLTSSLLGRAPPLSV